MKWQSQNKKTQHVDVDMELDFTNLVSNSLKHELKSNLKYELTAITVFYNFLIIGTHREYELWPLCIESKKYKKFKMVLM